MTDGLEQLYYDVTRPFRRASRAVRARLRWVFFRSSLETCHSCGAMAEWYYSPTPNPWFSCDACVSRGCICNVIDHSIGGETVIDPPNEAGEVLIWTVYPDGVAPEQHRDEQGRLLPCCEYDFSRRGWQRGRPWE